MSKPSDTIPSTQTPEYTIDTPVAESDWKKRLLIFTPTTGNVRMEWVAARYGQLIPTNWSMVEMRQFVSGYVPIEYQLADAQNILARVVVEQDIEWVLFIEHDNILPGDAMWKFNQYINDGRYPVVSGLYFTKTSPPEPVLYRGRGNSYYGTKGEWKHGDKVWVDGVPFGVLLLHGSLIKVAWEESEEYEVPGQGITRRVFKQPNMFYFDEEKGGMVVKSGTTDLNWCSELRENKWLRKAGWEEFQRKKYPYLVDTTIYCGHIDPSGRIYPIGYPKMPKPWVNPELNKNGTTKKDAKS